MAEFRFIDLFAGIGGFHAALTALGGECVYAAEIDEAAARIYELNWGMKAQDDVTREGWADELPEFEVLAAGFPCQPFSKSGAQKGMEEARGTLFFNICEALKARRPKVLLLENVRNIAGPRHKHEWEVIITSLRDLGYKVSSKPVVLSPSWLSKDEGGRPHNRERVFITGTWVGREAAWAAADEEPTVDVTGLAEQPWRLVSDLPLDYEDEIDEVKSLMLNSQEWDWVSAWKDLVSRLRAAGKSWPSVIWVDAFALSSLPTAPSWKRKILDKNRAFYLENSELLDRWLEEFDVWSFPESRRKFEWQAGSEEWRNCLAQFRPSGLRVKRGTTVGSLVAITQTPISLARLRRLSVRECARLQGLPEWFSFEGQPARASYKQLGNGVCVGAAYWVLREHLRAEGLWGGGSAPLSPDKALEALK